MKLFATRRVGELALSAVLALVLTPAGLASPMPDPSPQVVQDDGQRALAEARAHMDAGRWGSAAQAYAEALQYLPGNQEAIDGLREAQTLLDRGSTVEGVQQTTDVLRDQARVEFDDAMARAAEMLAQEDFEGATNVTLTAQIRLGQARNLFREGEYNQRNGQAEARLAEIERARNVARLERQKKEREEAAAAQSTAEAAERQRIATEISERLKRVRQLQTARKYDEALQVVDEILFLDELNPTALLLKDVLEPLALYTEYSKVERMNEQGFANNRLEIQKRLLIPRPNRSGPGPRGLNELMQYPEDWPGLSIMRTSDGGFSESPENRAVFQVLNTTSVPVDFTNNTFEQVVSFVEQVTGLTAYVDWKALDLIGVDREDEITLRLDNVPVATAIDRVLEQLGDDDVDRPQWAVQDGILAISSDEALRKRVSTIVYDIRDLLFEVPYYDNAPDLDLDSALSQGRGGGQGGGGGGGGGFGGGGGGGSGGGGGGSGGGGGGGSLFGDAADDPARLTRAELVEQIVGIIQENIDPDGWRDLGGDTGSLQEFNGNLIITNTPNSHRLIDGLLSQLREIRALQINIETRVLNVSTDWFEAIGVDLDVFFNTNNTLRQQQTNVDPLGQLGDFFNPDGTLKDPLIFGSPSQAVQDFNGDGIPDGDNVNTIPYGGYFGVPSGVTTNNFADVNYVTGPVGRPIRATQGFTPIGVSQDSLNLLDAIGAGTQFGALVAGATPALVTGLQFLDDIQVDLLVEATQADRRSMVLTAPRLTFFNGQRAWIAVTTQTAFVSGLQPIVGDASGAFQPIITTLSEGFVLDVEAVISSDRRYVTININFDQTALQGFRQTAPFQGAAGGGGQGGGNAQTFQGTIDLPILNGSFLRTTVSVPDKGTVLLGGTRTVSEVESETGVPILSKIPFVNRFFTNRQTAKEERTLLMLIRPEIIIQQENEDILFPGLSDTLGGAASYLR